MILYHTEGCHLCEEAEALILRLWPTSELEKVDVADCAEAMTRYGARIPVLCDQTDDRELGWPFDEEKLKEFLHRRGR